MQFNRGSDGKLSCVNVNFVVSEKILAAIAGLASGSQGDTWAFAQYVDPQSPRLGSDLHWHKDLRDLKFTQLGSYEDIMKV